MNNSVNRPVVWQLSVLLLDKKALISGVILKKTAFTYDKHIGSIKNFINICKTYFTESYGNLDIVITVNSLKTNTTTDNYGSFSLVMDTTQMDNLKISCLGSDKPLKILQTYPIIFENRNSHFDIISDIDDTIIISYTADFFRRIGTLALTPPQKRKTIDFTQTLFKTFKNYYNSVYYVSKSESNLFGFLTSFIKHNQLPKGHLNLTPYLNFRQLFNPKKGSDYKLNNIWFILKNTGSKKFILIGDDSQKDMEVYSEIVKKFPKRILKIYIRQTKRRILPYQKAMWTQLKSTEVPVLYFNSKTELNFETELKQLTSTVI